MGFFFVKKKDGVLWLCIDFQDLNALTVSFLYPLVPAALDQLREARIFSKLDIRSSYNLILIKERDHFTKGNRNGLK